MVTAADSGTFELGSLTVRRLGFGAMRLTGRWAFEPGQPPADRRRSIAVLRRAVELGVNHIDTAAFYFSPTRSANELINTALAPYPDDLVIATKVGPGRDYAGGWLRDVTADRLRAQVEENLRQLGRDHLDLVNFRLTDPGRPIAAAVAALAELRAAGMIREIGVSGVSRAQLDEARAVAPVVCVQNKYGLDARDDAADALVEHCGTVGIGYVPFFAIAGPGGRRGTDGAGADAPAVAEVARAHGVSPAQVRLAWTLHRGPHVLAIPGTGDPDHLADNVAAGALRLSAAELSRLDGRDQLDQRGRV
jgi:pyridoxine 4-dehydrogenase